MKRRNDSKSLPGKSACFFSGAAGLLLTFFLLMTAVTLLLGHLLTSDSLHERIATDSEVVNEQLHRIGEEVELMAEEYGFAPETVMNLISAEKMQNMNRDASRWLSDAFRNGKLRDTPVFHAESLGEALMADESFVASQDPYMLRNTIQQITGEVEKTAAEKAMAFREILLRAAERIAGKTVSLPTVSALAQQIPALLIFCSIGLAGLIALLTSRKMRLSLRYIGAAMSACGILLLIGIGMIALLGIRPILSEISVLISRKFSLLSLYATVLTGSTAIIMLILGIAGIRISQRGLR